MRNLSSKHGEKTKSNLFEVFMVIKNHKKFLTSKDKSGNL